MKENLGESEDEKECVGEERVCGSGGNFWKLK